MEEIIGQVLRESNRVGSNARVKGLTRLVIQLEIVLYSYVYAHIYILDIKYISHCEYMNVCYYEYFS